MAQPIWNTPVGTIGTYPYGINMVFNLSASAVLPAVTVTYKLISGSLPAGLTLNTDGLIIGIPSLVTESTTSSFTVRATDNLGSLRDRSFDITVSGSAVPKFSTPEGSILSTQDSVWVQYQIGINNPDTTNPLLVELREGLLPPGLEVSEDGVIRGYPAPPTSNLTLPTVITTATATSATDNTITCLSTNAFTVGRPVTFTNPIGNISNTITYYIKSIVSSTSFTISTTQNGTVYSLTSGLGNMTVTLPATSVGQPTIRTYSFVLRLSSPLGSDSATYAITVINQNTPRSQNGPGNPPNTRVPVILNTRPQTIDIPSTDVYYGYYIQPPVAPTVTASFGMIESGDMFNIKIIGYDFDSNTLQYSFSGLPAGVTGDPATGWITGMITLSTPSVSKYDFSVAVYKKDNPSITSPYFNYSLTVYYDNPVVRGIIDWVTPSDLGTIFNGTVSTLAVVADSDTPLSYRLTSGTLPPNLTLSSNGEITGRVALQPTSSYMYQGESTSFTFTVEAYSPNYSVVTSSRTFDLTVYQEYDQPTDTLYIKATPSISDRLLINGILNNANLIPETSLYRPDDQNFGKATSVIYEHAYGIYASDIQEYIAAVTTNHYWRNITLGEIKTAVARNNAGDIIYEVVYSEIIDNLVNPKFANISSSSLVTGHTYTIVKLGTSDFTLAGAPNNNPGTVFTATGTTPGTGIASTVVSMTSISEEIYWPRAIDLNLGPWYDSVTNIFTSYVEVGSQLYYTSLSPGYARILYPNSLPNMRNRVAQVLGQEFDSRLLPLWMTSQQLDGSTLGYTPAWVIAYTLPGRSLQIKSNIQNSPLKLNMVNFQIDRFTVDKSETYNYDKNLSPPAWTGLPSATPTPNPVDSKDFYVLFPRQTILPDETQY